MEVIFNPNQEHLSQIEEWLLEEKKIGINGFYFNYDNIISKAFSQARMLCVLNNNKAVGFLIYHFKSDPIIEIQILNIKDDYKSKGFGKFLFNEFELFLKENSIYAIELFCEPKSSEKYWSKRGFLLSKFDNNNKLCMYKIICDSLQISKNENDKDYIQLAVESHCTLKEKHVFHWKLEFRGDSNTLVEPIIYAVDSDWNIKYVRNKTELYNGQIKRFKNNIFPNSNFLVIKDLS